MTTSLNLDTRYVDVLRALGNLEDTLQEAVRSYAVKQIGERIGELQHEISGFQERYGLPYEKFYAQVTSDEEFVTQLRQSHPTWERDFSTWEYYIEELHEWLGRLESISKRS
ncbi:MAG: hypothetical protein GY801_14575 [bacterium]|nr:hypothetical protein [bacterium]